MKLGLITVQRYVTILMEDFSVLVMVDTRLIVITGLVMVLILATCGRQSSTSYINVCM